MGLGAHHAFFRAVGQTGCDGDRETRSGVEGPSVLLKWFGGLSFRESIVLTLGVRPSALNKVYWSHSYSDLKTLVSLRQQFEYAKVSQAYETLALVVSKALGTKETKSSKPVESMDELMAAIANVGGKIG